MIVILCNSFEEAQDGFDMFMDFLEMHEPWNIYKVWNSSYCVETDDNLRYIFIDYRLRSLFDSPDKIDLDSFLEGIDAYYFGN